MSGKWVIGPYRYHDGHVKSFHKVTLGGKVARRVWQINY